MRKVDVLVIGTGLAGIYAALSIDSKYRVCLIAKEMLAHSNSMLAQGGIAAELTDDPISLESHYEDTLKAGSYHNNKQAVKFLVSQAAEAIESLVDFGIRFDKDAENHYLLTREGGHSKRRILHSGGDATGYYTTHDLSTLLSYHPNIELLEQTMALDLIKGEAGQCLGATVLEKDALYYPIYAKATILATGGIGSVYGSTTNDLSATGDGIGMAHRIGADIIDMEFVQFHPTAFYLEGSPSRKRFLISEAVRGEGAILLNIEKQPFMVKYHPELKDLAPRDVVSQAIYREMYDTWTDHVYLDTRHLDPIYLKHRFPTIYQHCLENGIVLGVDLIPVSPCEHFICGGVKTDLFGETTIKNLYAIGEVACTGVHGANRLASNSLLECIVFGAAASKKINKDLMNFSLLEEQVFPELPNYHYNYKPLRKKIGDHMDEHVSIVRNELGLKMTKTMLDTMAEHLEKAPNLTRYYYEALNMIATAQYITNQAYKRKESIGCHFRLN
ncbi:MAG: L-aspartate oxidase [Candidatus Izemoplasmatales bacterium]|nr:L-aspartate oxidase [Candidatus Izemoplasmatales bacterium]